MRHFFLALIALVALAGCGNKGPLYLPPAEQPASPTEQDAPAAP